MWMSLIGAVLCIIVMFIMSWETALVTMAVIAVLFFYVHYRKPGNLTILLLLPLPCLKVNVKVPILMSSVGDRS